jgi:hypothetical protein
VANLTGQRDKAQSIPSHALISHRRFQQSSRPSLWSRFSLIRMASPPAGSGFFSSFSTPERYKGPRPALRTHQQVPLAVAQVSPEIIPLFDSHVSHHPCCPPPSRGCLPRCPVHAADKGVHPRAPASNQPHRPIRHSGASGVLVRLSVSAFVPWRRERCDGKRPVYDSRLTAASGTDGAVVFADNTLWAGLVGNEISMILGFLGVCLAPCRRSQMSFTHGSTSSHAA